MKIINIKKRVSLLLGQRVNVGCILYLSLYCGLEICPIRFKCKWSNTWLSTPQVSIWAREEQHKRRISCGRVWTHAGSWQKDTSLGPLFIHDSVTTFTATDWITRLYLIFCMTFWTISKDLRINDTSNRFKEWKRNFFVWCDAFLNSEDQTSPQAEGFNHLNPSLASSKLPFFLFLNILQNITQLGFSYLGSCWIRRIKACKSGRMFPLQVNCGSWISFSDLGTQLHKLRSSKRRSVNSPFQFFLYLKYFSPPQMYIIACLPAPWFCVCCAPSISCSLKNGRGNDRAWLSNGIRLLRASQSPFPFFPSPLLINTATVQRLPVTQGNFPSKIVKESKKQ